MRFRISLCLVFLSAAIGARAQNEELIRYLRACDGGEGESCVELVRRECGGATLAITPELRDAYEKYESAWRSLSDLEETCEKTWLAGYGFRCQAAAWIHATGCGVEESRERAHDLYFGACERGDERSCELLREGWCEAEGEYVELERACAAGDPAACRERARLHYNGCRLVDEAAVLGRGCEAGDAESCRQASILACRGTTPIDELPERALTLEGWPTADGDARWERCRGGDGSRCLELGRSLDRTERQRPRRCVLFARACAGDEWLGCELLAGIHDMSRPAYDRERHRIFSERAVELRARACEAGELDACFDIGLQSSWKPSLRELGSRHCSDACAGLSAEDCRKLAREDTPYAAYRECARAVLEQAVTLFEQDCESGDLTSCLEIGRTYMKDLRSSREHELPSMPPATRARRRPASSSATRGIRTVSLCSSAVVMDARSAGSSPSPPSWGARSTDREGATSSPRPHSSAAAAGSFRRSSAHRLRS